MGGARLDSSDLGEGRKFEGRSAFWRRKRGVSGTGAGAGLPPEMSSDSVGSESMRTGGGAGSRAADELPSASRVVSLLGFGQATGALQEGRDVTVVTRKSATALSV